MTAALTHNKNYTFTGRELDRESGLYYYRARYYDPGTGRFLQRDPHPGNASIPGTVINSHAYVLNNPTGLTDPTGRITFGAILGIIAMAAGAIFIGPAALIAFSAVGLLSLTITGATTGDWSFGNLTNAFLLGAGQMAAVALGGFGAAALAASFGAGAGLSLAAGAFAGMVGNVAISAAKAGGLSNLGIGGFLLAAGSGAIGGAAWGLTGFSSVTGGMSIPNWLPIGMGGTTPETGLSGIAGIAACAESTFGSQRNLEFCTQY